jgi:hypothetical protein
MQVYQTDHDRFLVGVTHADPDPLQPGEWLIPGGCVTTEPPTLVGGQSAQWTGDEWVIVEPEPEPEPPAPPTPEEILAAQKELYRQAVQDHIDETARSRQYENGFALASYVSSQVAPWRNEALAFVAWRDQVWLFVFETLAQVEAGDTPPPESPDALIGWLPQIGWPT